MTPIVPDQRARQASKGKPVLMVLLASLFLLGIYMVSLMLWSGSQTPDSASQDASREATTGAPSSANTSAVPPANPAYPAPAVPSASSPGATGATGSGQPPAR